MSLFPAVLDRTPLDPLRTLTIEHLEHSRDSTVPVVLSTWSDATRLVERKQALDGSTPRVTYTILLAKLLASTLADHPDLNATITNHERVRYAGVHLGIAIATPDGNLVVGVARDAHTAPLAELAAHIADLSERARRRKLRPADVRGATFTLSSIGMYLRRTVGTAIIPAGQTGILLASGISDEVVAVDGEVQVRQQLPISLTVDHRVANGAAISLFLRDLVARIEACDQDLTKGPSQ